MSGANKRVVQQWPDGKHEIRVLGAARATAVTRTQGEGIERAREILRSDGGGELTVRGRDGAIRKQDTVAAGNHPRSSRG